MINEDELETLLAGVQLDYRQLWLDDAHMLGQVAETLAEVLAWQPTSTQPLPNALALAEAARERIATLERQAGGVKHRASGSRAQRTPGKPTVNVLSRLGQQIYN